MITSKAYKNIAVFGLGRTGRGAMASLLKGGARVCAWDDGSDTLEIAKKEFPDALYLPPEEFDWANLEALLLSPGVPILQGREHKVVSLAREHNVKIISDLDLLYQACPDATYIGITGTNGKSTTTALIAHILKSANKKVEVGGNIGTSVLELKPLKEDGFYVLETSSFQLDLIQDIKFDIGVLLNITPDHLDRHGTMENYIEAKGMLFEHLDNLGNSIASVDYAATREFAAAVNISTKEEADVWVKDGTLYCGNEKYDLGELPYLPGEHNAENIAAAFAVCQKCEVDPEQIIEGIKSFKGLKHRMELVLERGGLKFINDSKATNADAAEKALLTFDNIYWIAGGRKKEGGIEKLSPLFGKIKHAYLIGEAQDDFAEILEEANCNVSKTGDLESALSEINGVEPGVVLFSPACSSFDQYKDFEARGDAFRELVLKKFK